MSAFLATLGPLLIEGGYDILPIQPGTKAPVDKGWSKAPIADESKLRDWVRLGQSSWGIGVRTAKTPALDIDVDDPGLAIALRAVVSRMYPTSPCRIGREPRSLFVFQGGPFKKRILEFIGGHKVELLGEGQQFVAYGIHKDTKKPYLFTDDCLMSIKHDDLPVIDVDRLFAAVQAEAERLGFAVARSVKRSAIATDDDDSWAEQVNGKIRISDRELLKSLLLVPDFDDYERRTQVGMALWHQYDGEQPGLAMFHEWASQSVKYNENDTDEIWHHYDWAGRSDPITARSILSWAREAADKSAKEALREARTVLRSTRALSVVEETAASIKRLDIPVLMREAIAGDVQKAFKRITESSLAIGRARDLIKAELGPATDTPDWLAGWVYRTSDDTFSSTKTFTSLSRVGFDSLMTREVLTWTQVQEGQVKPDESPTDLALNRYRIPIVERSIYMPGEGSLFTFEGSPVANEYDDRFVPKRVPRSVWSRGEKEAVSLAERHCAALFPDDRDRGVLLSAFSHIVKYPGKRLRYAILLQGAEGDGKTWFMHLLGTVLGSKNVTPLSAEALQEKYNGWAAGSQICFFEEIRLLGHSKFDVLNRIKPVITNDVVSIRRMNTDAYPAPNTSTKVLTTNFRDALPLDGGDTRFLILMSQFQTKGDLQEFLVDKPDHFDKLYGALRHGGALREWLIEQPVHPDFRQDGRAPESTGRQEMLEESMSEIDNAVADIIEEGETGTSREACSVKLLLRKLSEQGLPATDMQASHALRRVGMGSTRRMMISEERHRVWCAEPARFKRLTREQQLSLLGF
jgi:hypothetical protein